MLKTLRRYATSIVAGIGLLLVLLLGGACEQPWKPVHVIDSLRVIGIRADPPEVRPGQATQLEALVLDPSRPGERTTMLWLGCEPDPYAQNRGACGNVDDIGNPSSLADPSMLPPGVNIIGVGNRATYSTSPRLFDVLAADDPVRRKGTVGTIINVAVGAEVPLTATMDELRAVLDKVTRKEIASQLTVFRVRVSESTAQNVNPVIDDLFVNREVLPRGATIRLFPSTAQELHLTAHDFEMFDEPKPDGGFEPRTESVIVAWYTSAGRFDYDRVSLSGELRSKLTSAGDELSGNDPIPPDRRGRLWAVARDTRGGQVWAEWPWYICDFAAPLPNVTSVDRSNGLTLRGENLDQILDVVAQGAAVRGVYSPSSRSWVGDPAPGPLEVRAKNCLSLRVP